MLLERSYAKRLHRFDVADALRTQLKQLGAHIDDKMRTYHLTEPPSPGSTSTNPAAAGKVVEKNSMERLGAFRQQELTSHTQDSMMASTAALHRELARQERLLAQQEQQKAAEQQARQKEERAKFLKVCAPAEPHRTAAICPIPTDRTHSSR